jgi:SAM-dependent methyltransferase
VVAIERDARTVSRARTRAAEAGLHNINFVHTDIAEYSADSSFDAAVGRCILQFVPDPVAALRSGAKQVRPDGIVDFQEVSWAPCISLSAHLPLWSASVSLVHKAGIRSGVNMEMGPALHNVFQEAGLPAPRMRLEMELRRDPDFTRWVSDLVRSVLPQIQKLNFSQEELGDFDTLQEIVPVLELNHFQIARRLRGRHPHCLFDKHEREVQKCPSLFVSYGAESTAEFPRISISLLSDRIHPLCI